MKLNISDILPLTNLTSQKENKCLMDEYFEEENKKPINQRRNYAFLSCPCKKCNPYSM